MIIYKTGDIFTSKAELLVNPVNCVGVMGAGLAKQFKEKFPDNFIGYESYCDAPYKPAQPGGYVQFGRVLNVFTKGHWKGRSEREWIDMIAMSIAEHIPFTSIAIPPIGCDLGGLNKDEVHLILLREIGIYKNDEDTTIELWNFK